MPKPHVECEHCGETAMYVRTKQHDFDSRDQDEHVGSVPMVKTGDEHIYRCRECMHLTHIRVD
jgi:hypothetical protein